MWFVNGMIFLIGGSLGRGPGGSAAGGSALGEIAVPVAEGLGREP